MQRNRYYYIDIWTLNCSGDYQNYDTISIGGSRQRNDFHSICTYIVCSRLDQHMYVHMYLQVRKADYISTTIRFKQTFLQLLFCYHKIFLYTVGATILTTHKNSKKIYLPQKDNVKFYTLSRL